MNPPNETSAITDALANGLINQFQADRLSVRIYKSKKEMGDAAARAVAAEIRRLIDRQGRAAGIFSSALSQNEFLDALATNESIEWTRVIGFHLDEFLGMAEDHPQSHRKYLLDRLVLRVPMAEFHGIRGEAANPEAVCANYAALLKSRSPDFAVLEIGENGGLAVFGGQEDATAAVSVVELGEASRQRQVNDSVFAEFKEVPLRAISLTMPTLMSCPSLFVMAVGARKQNAVQKALSSLSTASRTASSLRLHPNANLFLDREAAAFI